jgi:hypothetical protein
MITCRLIEQRFVDSFINTYIDRAIFIFILILVTSGKIHLVDLDIILQTYLVSK